MHLGALPTRRLLDEELSLEAAWTLAQPDPPDSDVPRETLAGLTLPRRLWRLCRPALGAVGRLARITPIAQDPAIKVLRLDPQAVGAWTRDRTQVVVV